VPKSSLAGLRPYMAASAALFPKQAPQEPGPAQHPSTAPEVGPLQWFNIRYQDPTVVETFSNVPKRLSPSLRGYPMTLRP